MSIILIRVGSFRSHYITLINKCLITELRDYELRYVQCVSWVSQRRNIFKCWLGQWGISQNNYIAPVFCCWWWYLCDRDNNYGSPDTHVIWGCTPKRSQNIIQISKTFIFVWVWNKVWKFHKSARLMWVKIHRFNVGKEREKPKLLVFTLQLLDHFLVGQTKKLVCLCQTSLMNNNLPISHCDDDDCHHHHSLEKLW